MLLCYAASRRCHQSSWSEGALFTVTEALILPLVLEGGGGATPGYSQFSKQPLWLTETRATLSLSYKVISLSVPSVGNSMPRLAISSVCWHNSSGTTASPCFQEWLPCCLIMTLYNGLRCDSAPGHGQTWLERRLNSLFGDMHWADLHFPRFPIQSACLTWFCQWAKPLVGCYLDTAGINLVPVLVVARPCPSLLPNQSDPQWLSPADSPTVLIM